MSPRARCPESASEVADILLVVRSAPGSQAASAVPISAIAGLLAALLVTTSSAQAQDAPEPVRVIDEGLDPEVRGLIDALYQAAERDPGNADVHVELGLAYEANTMFGPAAASYSNVIALAPEKKQWAYRLGVMQQALGDIESALESVRVAAEAFKNTPVIQARLGDLLLTMGEVDEAAQAWERAIEAESKQPQAIKWPASRVGLARARYDQDRIEEAAKLLEEALSLSPTYRHAHYLLGLCYMDLGREEEAEIQLALGVNAWPQLPPDPHQPRLDAYSVGFSRRMMGVENMLQSGQAPAAEESLRAILAERPRDHMVLNLLSKALAAQGRAEESLEALRQSEEANPTACSTKIELTIALLNRLGPLQGQMAPIQSELQMIAQGQPVTQERQEELQAEAARISALLEALTNEILTKAQEGARLAPNLGRARYYNGLALYMTAGADAQRMQSALGEFEAALTLGCQEPELFRYAGIAFAQSGRLKEMLTFAEAFAERQPTNPNALTFVAQAYMTLDQTKPDRALRDKALAAIQRAISLAPNDPNMQQYRAAFEQEINRRNALEAPANEGPEQGPPLPPQLGGDDK